jgi:hypothetical protein
MRVVGSVALLAFLATFGLPAVTEEAAAVSPVPSNVPKALFLALPNNRAAAPMPKAGTVPPQLAQWNGSFVDHTMFTDTYTMVGSDPTKTNATTVVPVYIIPIKMVFGSSNGNATFDPLTVKLKNGQTLMQNVLASPIFQRNVTYVQGGTTIGKTQYIDAFQRANYWNTVSSRPNYHVLLGTPKVLPEQTIVVPQQDGNVQANPFGPGNVGTMYVNDFDALVQGFIAKLTQINPGVLPLFISYNTYLTEVPMQGCCIGGYHSAMGAQPAGQTYSYTTYVDSPGAFAENVSAMSHEVGEWVDDPFVDNAVNCADNQILEVGDPLENNANYGTFPYKVNNFTYNLQSLVFLGYFGAPPVTSVHSWLSFQNDEAGVCPGQNVQVNANNVNIPLVGSVSPPQTPPIDTPQQPNVPIPPTPPVP